MRWYRLCVPTGGARAPGAPPGHATGYVNSKANVYLESMKEEEKRQKETE